MFLVWSSHTKCLYLVWSSHAKMHALINEFSKCLYQDIENIHYMTTTENTGLQC